MATKDYVGRRFIPRHRLQFLNTQAAEADKPFTFTQALCDAGFDPEQWLMTNLVREVGAVDPTSATATTTASPTTSADDAKATVTRDVTGHAGTVKH